MRTASLCFVMSAVLMCAAASSAQHTIRAWPYVNDFESQADVNQATHVTTECIGQITYEPRGGWNNTGAFKMRIVDHPSASCPKEEDTAGMGTIDWRPLGGQSRINVGMLTFFGPNFYQPLDDNDLVKWILVRATDGHRSMLALRHFGGGNEHKIWQACTNAAGVCRDEFGWNYPRDHGVRPSDHSFQFDERQGQWIWIEFEVVVGGSNTVYIYTQDGALAGRYASIPSEIASGATLTSYIEQSYWEGASGTTAGSYVKYDKLTISNRFIGPPAGFVGGSSPDAAVAPAADAATAPAADAAVAPAADAAVAPAADAAIPPVADAGISPSADSRGSATEMADGGASAPPGRDPAGSASLQTPEGGDATGSGNEATKVSGGCAYFQSNPILPLDGCPALLFLLAVSRRVRYPKRRCNGRAQA